MAIWGANEIRGQVFQAIKSFRGEIAQTASMAGSLGAHNARCCAPVWYWGGRWLWCGHSRLRHKRGIHNSSNCSTGAPCP